MKQKVNFNFNELASGMPGAILIYKATGDEEILFASEELIRIFNCNSLEEFIKYTKNSFKTLIHPDDIEEVERTIWEQINAGSGGMDYVRYRVITKDGTIKHIEDFGHLVHSPNYGDIFYVFIHDLGERNKLLDDTHIPHGVSALFHENGMDTLTGLANMRYFRVRAPELINDFKKMNKQPAVVYFDINNFSSFNENYGFTNGDRLLKTIANILQDSFPRNLISRFSDDHFVIIADKHKLKEKLVAIRSRVQTLYKDFSLNLKAGIFEINDKNENIGLACDHAKLACQHIKRTFGVDFYVYDPELDEQIHQRNYIIEHLDEAITKQYIQVFFQPIVNLNTGCVCALEALARWNDPKYGVIMPSVFISTLEEYRLIHKLDYYMLHQICKQQRERQVNDLPVVPISLNISRLDFELADIVQMTENTVKEYNISKSLIRIEITESVVISDSEYLIRKVRRFQEAGFQMWMDDFGSEYSSLNVLQDYNFNLIKLDTSFLRSLEANHKSRVIISAVISMAKKLGMHTLIEGIETSRHVAFLKEANCEFGQGYYFGKPSAAYVTKLQHAVGI